MNSGSRVGLLISLIACLGNAYGDLLYRCQTAAAPFSSGSGGNQFVVDTVVDSLDRMTAVYVRTSDNRLVLEKCLDAPCTSTVVTVLEDDVNAVSTDIDVLLRPVDNRPVIAFADGLGVSTGIRLIICADPQCNTRNTIAIAEGSSQTQNIHPVISLTDGRPLLAYYNQRLELYRCTDSECLNGTASTADSTFRSGFYPSMAADANGIALISHLLNTTPGTVRLYRCSNSSCTTGTTQLTLLSAEIPLYSALALREGTIPVIGYSRYDPSSAGVDLFQIYSCTDALCSTGSASTPTNAGGRIRITDLALRPNQLAFASYASDADNMIYFNQCHDSLCQSSSTGVIAAFRPGNVDHSLRMLSDGTAVIVHTTPGSLDIALTRCSQPPDPLFSNGFEIPNR